MNLTLSNLEWLWPTLLLVASAAALIWWGYRTAPGAGLRWTCAGLKLAGITLLALCLLEPLWTGKRAKPGANTFVVLADTSRGLQVRDTGESVTRAEQLQELLLQSDERHWLSELDRTFDVRRFTFDSRLRLQQEFTALEFDGRASALGSSLIDVRERFEDKPLAGILLLTDGNATDSPDLNALGAAGVPIHPVVMGREGGARDLAVANLSVSQTAFEDAPVTVQADVLVSGFGKETVVGRLFDDTGRIVGERSGRVSADPGTLTFPFRLRPDSEGIYFYRFETRLQSESDDVGQQVQSREATLMNNSRVASVDRGRGPYRVLYVSGRPNWEYKFLNRALTGDPQVQLVALIRVANQEARFEFRGRSGETSNPLFRGTANQSASETERYDEAVVMRLNTRDEFELRGGFPSKEADLFSYHGVILDDVEADYFTADQMQLLQRYVSQRGGGLLMLGGMESFANGGYYRTPVGGLLPVYLGRTDSGQPTGLLQMDLAREGWLEPWVRLRDNEVAERARLDEMPGFQVMNTVGDIKPGASVVLTATDTQDEAYPALVTQRFGLGRTAALTIGDIWRWGMQGREHREDMDKFWRQLVRWLIADVPENLSLTVSESATAPSGTVTLRTRVRDEEFKPVDNASVTIEVTQVMSGTNETAPSVIRLRAQPASTEAGLYEAEHIARDTAGFLARVTVTNANGGHLGKAEAGWSVDVAAKEFASLDPNTAFLAELARRTGGELIRPDQLGEFVRRLPSLSSPVMETWTRPAWHTPVIFLAALACFVAEWGLRRWKGLP